MNTDNRYLVVGIVAFIVGVLSFGIGFGWEPMLRLIEDLKYLIFRK